MDCEWRQSATRNVLLNLQNLSYGDPTGHASPPPGFEVGAVDPVLDRPG